MYRETRQRRTARSSPAASCRARTRSSPSSRASRSSSARSALEVGKTATIDVAMAVGSLEETVNVPAESPLVDVTSKEIGGNITSETLVQLPSVNGNFIGFVGLLPGIVPSISTESFGSDSISVNGQDPRNNNYMLDGGNNNDDVIGQRAGMQARTPIEAIQEFQVITNQFDAEFGRTAGAVVNAVTKAGTNQRARQRLRLLPGRQPDDARTSSRRRRQPRQAGHQLPALGRHRRRADRARTSCTISSASSASRSTGPNTINIPARPDLNDQQTTQDRVWNTIIRGDHQVNANNTYSVRWLRETSPQLNQIIADGDAGGRRRRRRARSRTSTRRWRSTSTRCCRTPRSTRCALTWTRENVAFANALLQRQRPRPVEVRADAGVPGLHRPAGQHRRSRASTTASSRRHAGVVPARQARRPRHQVRRAVRVLRRRQRRTRAT